MDRDDALAYIMRYPVVMLEETSGIPADGNFSEIYKNAMTVGLRNNRNIKKGPDVKYDNIFTWHEANYGFLITGDALDDALNNKCGKELFSKYKDPEQDEISAKNLQREQGSGPRTFSELATFWHNYSKQTQIVPLFIRVKLDSNNPSHIIKKDLKTAYYPYSGTDVKLYLFEIVFSLTDYICMGDIYTKSQDLSSSVSVLFVHKSICLPFDINNLYTLMGAYSESGAYSNNKRVYVLRTALFKNTTEQPLQSIQFSYTLYILKQDYKRYNPGYRYNANTSNRIIRRSTFLNVANALVSTDISNDIGNTYYTFLTNPKTILNDLVAGFMMSNEGDYQNLIWKGINDDDGSSGNRFLFISTLCRLSPNIPAYPDLCACLGNGDEETELKKTNPKFSFFCYSQKCFQGDPGTYKFIPSVQPVCPPITMCDQRLEGNVFKFVKIDKSQCNQTINTSNLSPAKSITLTKRSYNAIFFTTIVLCVVFAIMVLIFNNNKNTV
jgi:hypothetical protein